MNSNNVNIPRGLRNNNPGNIRISSTKWQGEVRPSQDNEFKQFETMAYGYRAIFVLMRTYMLNYKLVTIESILHRYAPTNENDTDQYIKVVEQVIGMLRTEKIDINDKDIMIKLISAISLMENGQRANIQEVAAGWELFKN